MKLILVENKETEKQFLEVANSIQKDDPNRVQPLDNDIKKIFSPQKNVRLQNGGEAKRWILQSDSGEFIGRIAAFYTTKKDDAGGIGFFECINQQEAANMLFKVAEDWLEKQGFNAVEGAINFGEKTFHWGVQKEGHKTPTLYGHNHNPPYYNELFEGSGYKNYYLQRIFSRPFIAHEKALERFVFLNRDIKKVSPEYCYLSKKNLDTFVRDFCEAYNSAFSGLVNEFKPAEPETIKKDFKEMLPVLNPKMALLAYVDGKPSGFMITIPDLNEITKNFNGKFTWWHKIKLILNKKKIKNIIGLVSGVVPEHQRSSLIKDIYVQINRNGYRQKYKNFFLSWIGDFHPIMTRMMFKVSDGVPYEYITYRKYFDPNREFLRYREEWAQRKKEEKK